MDRYSLRWRLPLLVCGVVAVVLATFLWAALLRVQTTLLRAAGERAQVAADQVAGLLDGQRSVDQLGQFGADPVLRRFLELRTDETREAARTRLSALAGTALRRVELWDAADSRLLEISVVDRTGSAAAGRELPPGSPPFVHGARELQVHGDVVFSDLVAELPGDGVPLGHLLIRTTFSENPPGAFSRLVGRDAQVRVGNIRGDIWTNFSHAVPAPPVDVGRPGVAEYRAASGDMRLGAISHVRAMPMAVWVEFPRAESVAPAQMFLRQMIPVALLFLGVAAAVIGVLSARITRPLSELSGAAEAIAGGDYARRVTERRRDEIGRLARTFNVMAGQVQDAQLRLEARVGERTALLEAANSELEAFSYSVSHDLRAPLRSIDGFSQALQESAEARLDPEEKEHLHRVRRAAQRMGELIDDLLELARVGRADLNRQRADLSAIGGRVADELRRSAPQRQVQVDIQQGLVAQADRRLSQIVLENLFDNAWKFTARVERPTIQFGCLRSSNDVVYFVRDNGAGFDMAYAHKLFQPFQRLHRGAEFPGTGIGLATIRRVIERHGGRVWAEGGVDAGATVYFTLPEPAGQVVAPQPV
jgi:signal transduction histidine kinase